MWELTNINFFNISQYKNVLVLFHYQNNFERNSSSAIWWQHLPVASNNFFEAGVSGNIRGRKRRRSTHMGVMEVYKASL
jgi:hypothetical protein